MKKILLLTALAVIIGLFFIFDLNQQLTLDNVKAKLDAFSALRDDNVLLVSAIFFSVYVLITAVSLPGAVLMTLTAGALFGLLWGTLLVSFASSLGATLAFLTSRYLLRDTIENRFGERLSTINKGVARDGAFYLLGC